VRIALFAKSVHVGVFQTASCPAIIAAL